MSPHLYSDGQGGYVSKSYYPTPIPGPNQEIRVAPQEQDMEIGYEENAAVPRTLDEAERRFRDDILKLTKEQAETEDAEHARHKESIRIIQAMIDICANSGWLSSTLTCMHLMQMVMQGLWFDKNASLRMLPASSEDVIGMLVKGGIANLQQLLGLSKARLQNLLGSFPASNLYQELLKFPRIQMKVRLQRNKEGNESRYSLNVRLENVHKRKTSRAFAPRFPKVKEEAWWLVLGDSISSELFALKRVSFSDHLVTHMNLPSTAAVNQGLKLILVSDCYVGYELEHSLDHLLEPGH